MYNNNDDRMTNSSETALRYMGEQPWDIFNENGDLLFHSWGLPLVSNIPQSHREAGMAPQDGAGCLSQETAIRRDCSQLHTQATLYLLQLLKDKDVLSLSLPQLERSLALVIRYTVLIFIRSLSCSYSARLVRWHLLWVRVTLLSWRRGKRKGQGTKRSKTH